MYWVSILKIQPKNEINVKLTVNGLFLEYHFRKNCILSDAIKFELYCFTLLCSNNYSTTFSILREKKLNLCTPYNTVHEIMIVE